jgi:hypothetical protein
MGKIDWRDVVARGARAIVWLWPAESKEWGRAFAAELAEIDGFRASVWWLIGGAMLLTREQVRSFSRSLGQPIGVGANVVQGESWRLPRTPRVVTLLLFCGVTAFLLWGEMRTGVAMVVGSATGTQWDTARWSSVQELQRKAAETGDPKLLGLLSLLAENETESVRLASQAIARDESLTWLAYEFRLRGEEPDEAAIERARRVQMWDPQNAAPRLMTAVPIFDRIANRAIMSSLAGFVHTGELNQLEKAAAGNSEWMAAMDWAFSGKSYDTYGVQRLELVRGIARKYKINDPDVTARVVAGQMLPNLLNVRSYARVLLYRDAESRGDAAAMTDAWKVLHFTQQMQLHGRTLLEDIISTQIAVEACSRLQPLLERAGRTEEATLVGFERDRWTVELDRVKSRNLRAGDRVGSLVWAGVTMHLAVAAIALFAALSLAGLTLFVWQKEKPGWLRGLCSVAVDWAPLLLATACMVLFIAYHPYARLYQTYFQTQPPAMNAESMETLVGAASVPYYLPEGMEAGFRTPVVAYARWVAVTVILAMVAAILMLRGWKRRLA